MSENSKNREKLVSQMRGAVRLARKAFDSEYAGFVESRALVIVILASSLMSEAVKSNPHLLGILNEVGKEG